MPLISRSNHNISDQNNQKPTKTGGAQERPFGRQVLRRYHVHPAPLGDDRSALRGDQEHLTGPRRVEGSMALPGGG